MAKTTSNKKNLHLVTFSYEGKRYYVRAKTEKLALQKAAIKENDLKRGAVIPQKKASVLVRDYWEGYIDTYHANASPYTQSGYHSMFRVAIEPYIGSLKLREIKRSDIQRLYNYMAGKSASYVNMVRILLNGMFEAAIGDDLADKNPTKGAILPKAERGSRRALTEEERNLFLSVAPSLGDHGLFFLVIYYCGLRPSEVARIQGADIDRERRILHVRGTKTKAATRDVPIPQKMVFPERDGEIFLTARKLPPQRTAITKWWWEVRDAMAEESKKPVADDLTAYCLRHDYCTRLQEAGVPIDVARRLMGHSSIEMTSRIYTHESDSVLLSAQEMIDNFNAKI